MSVAQGRLKEIKSTLEEAKLFLLSRLICSNRIVGYPNRALINSMKLAARAGQYHEFLPMIYLHVKYHDTCKYQYVQSIEK